MELTAAEVGLVRWLRTVNHRTLKAIDLWLFTGDNTLLLLELTRPDLKVAA